MCEWLARQLDYILLWHGLALLLTAGICLKLSRRNDPLPWRWLGVFGLLQAVNLWLNLLAASYSGPSVVLVVRTATMVAGYLALVEFGRQLWLKQPGGAPGRWVCPALVGLAALGCLIPGVALSSSAGWVLGLPGGLLSGWMMLREGRRAESARRRPLLVSGIALLIYGASCGLPASHACPRLSDVIVPGYSPSDLGLPGQLAHAVCALVILFCVWFRYWGYCLAGSSDRRIRVVLVSVALAILFACGLWLTNWRGQLADRDQREHLLQQATAVARTIHYDMVEPLSFTLADKADPRFQRTRSQMIAYAEAILPSFGPEAKYLSIYSMARRGDKILFGPESIDEADSRASPPGTIYYEPPSAVHEAFESQLPRTVGPYKDEYGTFVSAFVPVIDLRTNKVVLVIGMDIEAASWMHRIIHERFFTLLLSLTMILVVLINIALLEDRSQFPPRWRKYAHHIEAIATGTIGVTFTSLMVYWVQDNGIRSRAMIFSNLAEARTLSIVGAMRQLRDTQLEGLGRLFDSRRSVTWAEFQDYAEHLCQSGTVQAWEWVPAVDSDARQRIEDSVHRERRVDFAIWQKDTQGNRQPAGDRHTYYPVYYVAPEAGNAQALGYDLGSEPIRDAALEEAGRTDMVTATDPVTLVQETGTQRGILVFRPVSSAEPGRHLEGFTLAVLRLGSMLRQALAELNPKEATVVVDLYQLRARVAPCFLASSTPHNQESHIDGRRWLTDPEADGIGLANRAPLFFFGKSYALVVHPGSLFIAANPVHDGWVTGAIGFLLTAMSTVFMGSLSHRRAALQREVEMRTAALDATGRMNAITQREEARVKALLELNRMTIHTSDDLAEYALEAGISLTGSRIGYIAFVSEDEGTLRIAHYSKSAMAMCALAEKPFVFAAKDTGLWGEPLRQRKPIITNDYRAPNPWKKGTPPGHIEVVRHMSVPVLDEGRVVLLAAVGNKDTDYTEEDVIQLRLLMEGMWSAFRRKEAEQALKEREEQYRTLIANLPIGLFRKTPGMQGRFLMANPAVVKMSGYDSVEEFLQLPVSALFTSDLSALTQELLAKGYLSGSLVRMKRRDGKMLWVSITAKATRDAQGNVIYLDGMVEDVTARKQAEEALIESEEMHRSLFESSQDALMTLSVSTGTFASGNRAALRLFGAGNEEEFCTKGPGDVSPEFQPTGEPSSAAAKRMVETALREGSHFFEWQHKTLGGEEFPATVLLTRVEMRGQTLVQATVRNVAEQKRVEDALRESESRFKSITEYATDAIIMIGAEGEITFWNPAAERILGYAPEDVLGRDLHELLAPEPYRQAYRKAFPAFQTTGQGVVIGVPLEMEAVRKDGTVFPVELSISPIRRADGYHAVGILRDITERKGAEIELREGNAMILEALEREKRVSARLETTMQDLKETQQRLVETSRQAGMAEIATGVLHNVGNVLNSVNVSTSLIAEKLKASRLRGLRKSMAMFNQHADDLATFLTQDEKGRQLPAFLNQLSVHLAEEQDSIYQELKTLSDNVDHIKTIVARQQDYARHSNVIEDLVAVDIVKDALNMCDADLKRSGVELIREYEPVPMARGDRHKVLQILVNLIRNAEQAMREPTSQKKVMTLRVAPVGETGVRIEVSDTGTGIQSEHLPRLFTHGFTTKAAGHGFGLHNSALAAKEMNGSLTAKSDGFGSGATFTLELPATGVAVE